MPRTRPEYIRPAHVTRGLLSGDLHTIANGYGKQAEIARAELIRRSTEGSKK